MTVEIVILAMIAVFLGLRLFAVLGRRGEHGEEPVQRRLDVPQGGIGLAPPVRAPDRAERLTAAVRLSEAAVLPSVERALRAIAAADRRFDIGAFVDSARDAYRMILEAFWRGDREELRQLCDGPVAESFIAAIDRRAAAGEVLDNRLVRITDAHIDAASFTAPHARITMHFIADIAAITRDAAGTVIAGSLNDAVEVRDAWTFARDVSDGGRDWLLDETDEA